MLQQSCRVYLNKTEKDFLAHLVEAWQDKIECKRTDAVSNVHKKNAWDEVAEVFNVQGFNVEMKTGSQLRKCWENMKTIRRRELIAEEQMRLKTESEPEDEPENDTQTRPTTSFNIVKVAPSPYNKNKLHLTDEEKDLCISKIEKEIQHDKDFFEVRLEREMNLIEYDRKKHEAIMQYAREEHILRKRKLDVEVELAEMKKRKWLELNTSTPQVHDNALLRSPLNEA